MNCKTLWQKAREQALSLSGSSPVYAQYAQNPQPQEADFRRLTRELIESAVHARRAEREAALSLIASLGEEFVPYLLDELPPAPRESDESAQRALTVALVLHGTGQAAARAALVAYALPLLEAPLQGVPLRSLATYALQAAAELQTPEALALLGRAASRVEEDEGLAEVGLFGLARAGEAGCAFLKERVEAARPLAREGRFSGRAFRLLRQALDLGLARSFFSPDAWEGAACALHQQGEGQFFAVYPDGCAYSCQHLPARGWRRVRAELHLQFQPGDDLADRLGPCLAPPQPLPPGLRELLAQDGQAPPDPW